MARGELNGRMEIGMKGNCRIILLMGMENIIMSLKRHFIREIIEMELNMVKEL